MSYKLFANVENMIGEVNQMETDERPRREDRVTVSDFYHGQPPYSQEEAEAIGLTINVNNLFGYEHLNTASGQLLALYTNPARLWEIQLDNAPASKKTGWEAKVNMHWNRIMKDSGRLKHVYEFAAGDCTMHGEGMLWNPSSTDWCPRHCSLARRLIPSGATLDLADLTHFAIDSEMTFQAALKYSQRGGKGWNRANLRKMIEGVFNKEMNDDYRDARSAIDQNNEELIAYHRQANASFDRHWKHAFPVVYFFQVNFDDPTRPYDVTVLSRNAISSFKEGKKDFGGHAVLFEKDGYFKTINQGIFPLHMNSAIGGEALWHRVKGLGHLNYQLSWHLEVLMNRAMQAAHEQNTTFFQAADQATREAMEQILLKHNGIIPEGITMVQNRVGSDFKGLLALLSLIRQQGATNANSIAPNTGEGADALEVQAVFQQNMAGANSGNRVAHWFDYMNRLGAVVFSRFTNALIQPIDPGYSEIKDFHGAMMREGIPLSYLQPSNCRITTARVMGNGIRQQAVAGATALMERIALYGPEAQQDIKRMFTTVVLDDAEAAEKLVPYTDTPDTDQVMRAENENNVFAVQQKAMKVNDSDVDQVHIGSHFDYMVGLLRKAIQAQKSTFTPDQLQSFKVAGGHTELHIRKVEPIDKNEAAKYREELNKLAAAGQKMANNLQQQAEAQAKQPEDSKPMSEADMAKLKIETERLRQTQEKIDFGREKFDRTQGLREHGEATRQLLDMERANREDKKTKQEMAIRDVETAASLSGGAAK